jgi:hypothetical protein
VTTGASMHQSISRPALLILGWKTITSCLRGNQCNKKRQPTFLWVAVSCFNLR